MGFSLVKFVFLGCACIMHIFSHPRRERKIHFASCVRGYHIYKDRWIPVTNEELDGILCCVLCYFSLQLNRDFLVLLPLFSLRPFNSTCLFACSIVIEAQASPSPREDDVSKHCSISHPLVQVTTAGGTYQSKIQFLAYKKYIRLHLHNSENEKFLPRQKTLYVKVISTKCEV